MQRFYRLGAVGAGVAADVAVAGCSSEKWRYSPGLGLYMAVCLLASHSSQSSPALNKPSRSQVKSSQAGPRRPRTARRGCESAGKRARQLGMAPDLAYLTCEECCPAEVHGGRPQRDAYTMRVSRGGE